MSTLSDADWDGFVSAHPAGTFFHLSGWRDVAQTVFGHRTHQLSVRTRGAPSGVLPLLQVRSRLFGHSLIANGFCVGGGPIASDADSLKDLLDQAEHLARKLGVAYVELRDTPVAAPGWTPKSDLYAGFERPLASSEEENFGQIPRKQRKVLRLALERGLEMRVEHSAASFFPLYARGMRDHGTPALPPRYFEELFKTFGDNCEVITISNQGRPISSVLSYFHQGRVMPYYMGSHPDAREMGANAVMIWSVMRRAVDRGCSLFDYGRSKVDTGPYSHKINWGFEPRPITHQYRLLSAASLPRVNPTNPRYAAMIQLWRRLPLPLANTISPFLSRSLG
jgi:FemAB-related protein (PEP-CTERM system-associated)